jgi:hypothetical protein
MGRGEEKENNSQMKNRIREEYSSAADAGRLIIITRVMHTRRAEMGNS